MIDDRRSGIEQRKKFQVLFDHCAVTEIKEDYYEIITYYCRYYILYILTKVLGSKLALATTNSAKGLTHHPEPKVFRHLRDKANATSLFFTTSRRNDMKHEQSLPYWRSLLSLF